MMIHFFFVDFIFGIWKKGAFVPHDLSVRIESVVSSRIREILIEISINGILLILNENHKLMVVLLKRMVSGGTDGLHIGIKVNNFLI